MRNILLLLSLLLAVIGCSSSDDKGYYEPKNKVLQESQRRMPQQNQIVKSYPAPKTLEKEKGVFTRFSSFSPVKVALLVPLSGKYAQLGQSLLDSAQLALFSIDEPNLILVPIDTKGTSYGAVEAANKAVAEEVKIILGPVFGKSAKAIATIASDNNLSVVSFSNDKSLADSGVFAIGFRPEQQIERIVEFAMEQGVEDFATVIPNDAYGAAVAKQLRETVAQNDMASVLKTEIYRNNSDGKPRKLSKHVYSAFDSIMNTKPPKDYNEEEKKFNHNPIRFPRAILVPEGGKRLVEITYLLKKFRHNGQYVKLLGSSQWLNDATLKNNKLEGAWFAAPPKDRRDIFEGKFMSIFEYEPNKIASLAYDGMALAATIARLSSGNDFSKEALSNPRGFIGVDGIFRFNKNGLTERGLAVMTVKDGRFAVVSEAPRNFFEVREDPSSDIDG